MKFLAISLWVVLLSLVGFHEIQRWQERGMTPSLTGNLVPSVEDVSELDNGLLFVDYVDADYGFSMVVPQGWRRSVADGRGPDNNLTDLGYSVTFESAVQNDADPYVDYIMVEVLLGTETGAFDSDGSHREVVTIDGQTAVRDTINLPGYPFDDAILDLTIRQVEIAQLGFTVGLYAIGTKDNAEMLDEAFGALVYSFVLPDEPFLVAAK